MAPLGALVFQLVKKIFVRRRANLRNRPRNRHSGQQNNRDEFAKQQQFGAHAAAQYRLSS